MFFSIWGVCSKINLDKLKSIMEKNIFYYYDIIDIEVTIMSSVTQRIKEVQQPRGGYVKVSCFDVVCLNDDNELYDDENVHSSITGMVVDYMTRYMMGADIDEAFKISIMGATLSEKLGKKNAIKEIQSYLNKINGLDNQSIINACKAATFDVWYRNPMAALMARYKS